jgi:hypothetical protein
VTPGHLGDVRVATALISAVPTGGSLAAGAAYDSDGLRRFLKERGTVPPEVRPHSLQISLVPIVVFFHPQSRQPERRPPHG